MIHQFDIRFKAVNENGGEVEYNIPFKLQEGHQLQTMEFWMNDGEILPIIIFPFQLDENGYVRREPVSE